MAELIGLIFGAWMWTSLWRGILSLVGVSRDKAVWYGYGITVVMSLLIPVLLSGRINVTYLVGYSLFGFGWVNLSNYRRMVKEKDTASEVTKQD